MKRFKKILLYAPLNVQNEPALRYAARLAQRNNGTVKVFDCVEPAATIVKKILPSSWNLEKVINHDRQSRLRQMVDALASQGIEADFSVVSGNPAEEITREVMHNGYDIVVKTAQGAANHKEQGFFSTTAIQLMRVCPCAVCIVDPVEISRFKRILVAVDPQSEDPERHALNRKIMEMGLSLAEREEAQIDIIASWSAFGESILDVRMSEEDIQSYIATNREEAQKNLDRVLEEFNGRIDPKCLHIEHGDLDRIVLDFTEKNPVDILVIGTVARQGISGMLMGNVAEKVLHKIRCGVLAVKPDNFKSPVSLDKTKRERNS
ncbi:MAG: universal stress protein [Acidobacteriota bacterium]